MTAGQRAQWVFRKRVAATVRYSHSALQTAAQHHGVRASSVLVFEKSYGYTHVHAASSDNPVPAKIEDVLYCVTRAQCTASELTAEMTMHA